MAPYGISKLCGEHYVELYNRLYGERHVVLRYGNVYGPRQDPHGEAGVVAIFFGKLVEGATPLVFGDGSQTRDYVYVGDVVAANLAALGYGGAHAIFNVGTATETSVLDLLAECQRAAGTDVAPEHRPARLGELARSALDPSLAAARASAGGRPRRSPTASPRPCARSPASADFAPRAGLDVRPTGRTRIHRPNRSFPLDIGVRQDTTHKM